MNKYELINNCRISLNVAESGVNNKNSAAYYQAMRNLLDFLLVELIGGASNETQTKVDNINS